MATEIAQLIVPDDGGGNPQYILPDWPNGTIYFVSIRAIRCYRVVMETQTPVWSILTVETPVWSLGHDIDPLSGDLIMQRTPGAGLTNGQPVNRYDKNTFAIKDTFGVVTSYPNWPDSIWAGEGLICVAVGTLASGGAAMVSYSFIKMTVFSGIVSVIRNDVMEQAGFHENVVSGGTNNRAFMCRGRSGPAGGSMFITWSTVTGQSPTRPLWTVEIAPGAETYNTASWPATNPYITQHLVGNITATSIDPTWTNFVVESIGYNQSDNTLLMTMSTSDAVAQKTYVTKINPATAGVIWASPTRPTNSPVDLVNANVTRDLAGLLTMGYSYLGDGDIVFTQDGVITPTQLGGVIATHYFNATDAIITDDLSGLYFIGVNTFDGTRPNAAIPMPGTPMHFTNGYAFVRGLMPPPPVITRLTDAELVFQSGFMDLSVEAVRRLFVSAEGTPAWMERDGSIPFNGLPAVYLTTMGPPLDFTQNNGDGGSFPVDGIIDPANGPGCSNYYIDAAAGVTSDPHWRLTVSDDGGRTWSRLVKPRALGATGKYLTRLRWQKMGQSRERMVRLECTDSIRNNIIGIYIDLDQGMA